MNRNILGTTRRKVESIQHDCICVCVCCAPPTASFDFTQSNHFCHSQKHAEKAIFSFRTLHHYIVFFCCSSLFACVFGIFIVLWCVLCSRCVAGTLVFLLNTHHKYAVRVKSRAMAWHVRVPAIHLTCENARYECSTDAKKKKTVLIIHFVQIWICICDREEWMAFSFTWHKIH